MKTLKLADIVEVINGQMIQGNAEFEINKVAKLIKISANILFILM